MITKNNYLLKWKTVYKNVTMFSYIWYDQQVCYICISFLIFLSVHYTVLYHMQ